MNELPKDKETSDFLGWLFTNPRAAALLAETLRPEDKPARVLQIWRDCWKDDRAEAETYMALALAVAVDFDDPIAVNPKFYGQDSGSSSSGSEAPAPTNIDPVERYALLPGRFEARNLARADPLPWNHSISCGWWMRPCRPANSSGRRRI